MLTATSYGQGVRTWVSGSGLDNASCTRSAPCRTFTAATAAVGSGGEVVVLDSGGYGPFVIDKPVSIIAPAGVHAAIAPTAGTAITIGDAVDGLVVLRGLYLNGMGAHYGLQFLFDGKLHIDRCVFDGFLQSNIESDDLNDTEFFIKDTLVTNSGLSGLLWRGQHPAQGVIEDSVFDRNYLHVGMNGSGQLAVHNTTASNGNTAFSLFGETDPAAMTLVNVRVVNHDGWAFIADTPGTETRMYLENCHASGNWVGIQGHKLQTLIRVSNSTIVNNDYGVVLVDGAQILSRGDNTLEDNDMNNTFPATFNPK